MASREPPQRPPYGATVTHETAKRIGERAIAEAIRNGWRVAVAIVDNHGFLVYFERLDDTQTAPPIASTALRALSAGLAPEAMATVAPFPVADAARSMRGKLPPRRPAPPAAVIPAVRPAIFRNCLRLHTQPLIDPPVVPSSEKAF